MNVLSPSIRRRRLASRRRLRRISKFIPLFLLLRLLPVIALAQTGSPFDTGFSNLQNLFTRTVAKVASLIAIVIGGYEFAHGEPGAKKIAARSTLGSTRRLLSGNLHQPQQVQACLTIPL